MVYPQKAYVTDDGRRARTQRGIYRPRLLALRLQAEIMYRTICGELLARRIEPQFSLSGDGRCCHEAYIIQIILLVKSPSSLAMREQSLLADSETAQLNSIHFPRDYFLY
jgi:hypothetical protein